MKTSTLLVLLGMSIITVSMVSFASFVLANGTTGPFIAPAGSVFSVALLLGLSQILIGRALRPTSYEAERPSKKEKQRMIQSSQTKMKGREEEEEPHVISVEDQEPAEWLKTTLEKLAEQGSGSEEETVKPAEFSTEPVASSRPRTEERAKPLVTPPPKVHGSLVNTSSDFSRPSPRVEPITEPTFKPQPSTEPENESIPARKVETQLPAQPPGEEEEPGPGVRRLREMEITFVERDGITFLEAGTGIHERYPCEDQSLIDYAWRALVRGLKVNVDVEGGKVTKLTPVS